MKSLPLFPLKPNAPRGSKTYLDAYRDEWRGDKCSSLQLRFTSLEHLCSSFLALERSNHELMEEHKRANSTKSSSHTETEICGQIESLVVSKHLQLHLITLIQCLIDI